MNTLVKVLRNWSEECHVDTLIKNGTTESETMYLPIVGKEFHPFKNHK